MCSAGIFLALFLGVLIFIFTTMEDSYEAEGDLKAGETISCSIQFITKGTCTPCGFGLSGVWGSCGSAAWEFFRSREE